MPNAKRCSPRSQERQSRLERDADKLERALVRKLKVKLPVTRPKYEREGGREGGRGTGGFADLRPHPAPSGTRATVRSTGVRATFPT